MRWLPPPCHDGDVRLPPKSSPIIVRPHLSYTYSSSIVIRVSHSMTAVVTDDESSTEDAPKHARKRRRMEEGQRVTMHIRVRLDQAWHEPETIFKIRKNTQMQRVFEVFAQRHGFGNGDLRYTHGGSQIEPADTAFHLGLENLAVITCHQLR